MLKIHAVNRCQHTLEITLQNQLQVRINTKHLPGGPQTPAPCQLGTHTIVLFHVVLRESRLRVVRVAWICELELASRTEAALDPLALGAALSLDTDHLRLLDDANLGTGGEVHENADTAREATFGVWDRGWVVSDQEGEFELWVVIQDMVVLEARSRSVVVCYAELVRLIRSPLSHFHGHLTNDGELLTEPNLLLAQ